MGSALGWVGKIAEFIGSLFPRLVIVEATHRGIAFKWGKHIIPLAPGVHVYWPFLTTIQMIPTVRQTTKLPMQALTTSDGKQIAVCGMVRYKIRNITKALAETWELDTAIVDESLVVLCDLVTSRTFAEIQSGRKALDDHFTQRTKKMLADYGVAVLKAHLTDFSQCMTLNHLGEVFRSEPTE